MSIKIETNEFITTEDLRIFAMQSEETLAQWWCDLNSFRWPEPLPNEDRLHEDRAAYRKARTPRRRSLLMDAIMKLVGHRLISWTWNKERMTEEEHKDFFDGNFEGDKEAKKRYDERVLKKLNESKA